MKTNRGVVDPVTLSLVALVALGVGVFGTSFKPFEFLKPKPPTAELTKLQAQLTAQEQAAAQAKRDAETAKVSERAKLEAEIRAAQQDNVGTAAALARVAPEHRVAEVKLAGAMAERVTLKLAAAIGALPAEQQQAMVALIAQALSDKQAEIDSANAKLAARDAAFATLAADRDAVKAQIPVLEQKAVKAQEEAKATESKVAAKTEEVKVFAAKADAKEREAGSIGGALKSVERLLLWIAGAYLFLAFGLPGIVKHLATGPVKNFLRGVSGYLTSPLLFHDARLKIEEGGRKIEDLIRQTQSPFPPKP